MNDYHINDFLNRAEIKARLRKLEPQICFMWKYGKKSPDQEDILFMIRMKRFMMDKGMLKKGMMN